MMIPFNKATLAGNEFVYIADAIQRGHISGDGQYTRKCHRFLENLLKSPRVLLTTSCTHALEMAAILLDLQEGDEILLPSYTFVSTANAFILHKARPTFVDIREDTLNIDERLIERQLSDKTKAIVVVHYAGIGCEMDPILEMGRKRSIPIIEDNAHGLFGSYKSRLLGTLGTFAGLSFHETKNITCGEGGAFIINDAAFTERAEIIREKGTNRSRFFRGEVDKYSWMDVGSSYLPSDILAAFLLAQLEDWEHIQRRRQEIWHFYYGALASWAEKNGVKRPFIPSHCGPSYHLFHLVMPTPTSRDFLIRELKDKGIMSIFHYLPLHLSKMGARFGFKPGDCPVTERISESLVRLPFHNSLKNEELETIVETINRLRL